MNEIKFILLLIFTTTLISGRKSRDLSHRHHHHHSSHHHSQETRGRRSRMIDTSGSEVSNEPTAMISLVDEDKDGQFKLQVAGDGQLSTYLKTLENVPDSFYTKPHIITDMDESILPQATHIHPRREGAISAIRLETDHKLTNGGQLDRSGSSTNERYYDQDESDPDATGSDDSSEYSDSSDSDSSRKQVYYDDESASDSSYRYKDRRERYTSRDSYLRDSRDSYPRDSRDSYAREPSSRDTYVPTRSTAYVIHKDYLERDRIPKEYILPIEGSESEDSSGRIYARSRDRETLTSDEYIHLPRDNSQTYVIREREVVVPSNKELIQDYLPVREIKSDDRYEENISGYGEYETLPKYTLVEKYGNNEKYSNGEKYGSIEKYSNGEKYGNNEKYDTNERKTSRYGYNMRDLLKELNSESGKNQEDGVQLVPASDDDTSYGTYRDAVIGRVYNVPKNDYVSIGEEDRDGNQDEDQESHTRLQEQIVQQQIALQQQEQLMQAEIARKQQQDEAKVKEERMKEDRKREDRKREEREERKSEGMKEKSKEKVMEEIKVEFLSEKDGKKKNDGKRIIATSNRSMIPVSISGQSTSSGGQGTSSGGQGTSSSGQRSGQSKNGQKKKENVDLKTLRTVLSKLIKQVEEIQAATAKIITGNIDPLPVHSVPVSSKGRSSKAPKVESKRKAPRKSPAPSDSKQSKVFLRATDLVKMLTGDINPLPVFGSTVRSARPAIPIAAMASMATATRVPPPFPFYPYPMFNPAISIPAYYPGPWFEDKKKK